MHRHPPAKAQISPPHHFHRDGLRDLLGAVQLLPAGRQPAGAGGGGRGLHIRTRAGHRDSDHTKPGAGALRPEPSPLRLCGGEIPKGAGQNVQGAA